LDLERFITNGISLILVDVPRPDTNGLTCGGCTTGCWRTFAVGVTTSISEVGAEIALTQAGLPTIATGALPVTLEILEEIPLQGQLKRKDSVVNFLLGRYYSIR